jgi:hypothetical protein
LINIPLYFENNSNLNYMSEYFQNDEIVKLFNENIENFSNPAHCLAFICFRYNLRPCCIQHCSLEFNERAFFKKLSNYRKGDGDIVKVYIIIINYLFDIYKFE